MWYLKGGCSPFLSRLYWDPSRGHVTVKDRIHISSKMNHLKPKHFLASHFKHSFLFFPYIVKKFISAVKLDIFKTRVYGDGGSSWNCNTASYLFVMPEMITFCWPTPSSLITFLQTRVSCFSTGAQKSLDHSSIVCKPNKTPCIHRISCICLQ